MESHDGHKLKRVRIKIGTMIYQDFHTASWPECSPPASEYEGKIYQRIAKNHDMEFVGVWNGRMWSCMADGYGSFIHDYGNGRISIYDFHGVEILGDQE